MHDHGDVDLLLSGQLAHVTYETILKIIALLHKIAIFSNY